MKLVHAPNGARVEAADAAEDRVAAVVVDDPVAVVGAVVAVEIVVAAVVAATGIAEDAVHAGKSKSVAVAGGAWHTHRLPPTVPS